MYIDIERNPILNCYGLTADLISLISKVDKKNIWLINNCNNIRGFKPDMPFYIYLFDGLNRECNMSVFYECPFIDFQKVSRCDKDILEKGIISFVLYALKQGYAVIVHVERKYIQSYHAQDSSMHEIMIYGVDEAKQEFILCDNDLQGKYRQDITCSYKELEKAYIEDNFQDLKNDLHNSIVLLVEKISSNRHTL